MTCALLHPLPVPYVVEIELGTWLIFKPFSCRFQKINTHTPPPPPPDTVMACLHIEAKLAKLPRKGQNPPRWHLLNEANNYANLYKAFPAN